MSDTHFATCKKATVAQLVEHLTRNEDVSGSIPDSGSSNVKQL